MSLSYSLTFKTQLQTLYMSFLHVGLPSYCRKWTRKGGHFVYANQMVKEIYILHVFIIFSDLQNIGIDTLYVIFACRVTELLTEMDPERRPFCLCKLDVQPNIFCMSLSYSLTFKTQVQTLYMSFLLVWLHSYCKKWTKEGGHFVYANQMVKNSKFLLGTGFIGFSIPELC